jgi:hypothetical protein
MGRVEQRKIATIDRGLFLVRYTAAEDELRPPKVKVVVGPQQESDVLLILHPDHEDAVLWQPGSCLVVMATSPGEIVVEVSPTRRDGSSAATVQVEPLTQGEAASPVESGVKPTAGGGDIRVLGHVAGIGDVLANADTWLAGPTAPSRIEGFAVEWLAKPNDLNVRYSVKTARPQANSGRMMDLGSYAGTRGRALPIVGLVLELSGPGALRYQLAAEAIFLGSPRLRATGKRVTLSGPTGREPLVGFRLRLDEVNARPQPVPSAAPVPVRSGRSSGRVRVVQSRAQPAQSLDI